MPGIPTYYRGVRFRSRLEARWAAFFDSNRWRWDYEPIDLDGWIPDFVLHAGYLGVQRRALVEVKPIYEPDKAVVAKILAAARTRSENIMLLGVGVIWLRVLAKGRPVWTEYQLDEKSIYHAAWLNAGNTTQWKGER